MQFNTENIRALLTETMDDDALYIVDIAVSESAVKPKVTIKADSDEGISIDQCAKISRRLARKIEEVYGEEQSYVLEVTSPGVDQPLTSERQYRRNVGRKLRVLLQDGTEKTGALEEVSATGIRIAEEQKGKNKKAAPVSVDIAYEDIAKTTIIISFK